MDTESIASEIVYLRNRIRELDEQLEGRSDTDPDDERKQLEDRMHELQDRLAGNGNGSGAEKAESQVQYIPPG